MEEVNQPTSPSCASTQVLSSEILLNFHPTTGTEEQWNAAYERLADYFRAHRLHSRLHRTHLILETLRRAAKTHAVHSDRTPTYVAIHEARRMQRAWQRSIMTEAHLSEGTLEANGRLAFLMCDGPARWPNYYLKSDDIPEDLARGMQRRISQSGPDLAMSSMVPRQIDLGLIPDLTDDTMETFERYPVLRYIALLIVTGLVLWGVWEITT